NKDKHRMEMTRRNFLKAGAAVTGALAAPSLAGGTGSIEGESAPRIDREVMSCCQFCQVRCTTLVQVKNDKVINVYGNPENTWTKGSMCPKGQSLVELMNNPHRLLYPLKREGGSWKRISYKESVDLVAEHILKVKDAYPEDYAHRVALFEPLWESHESEVMAQLAVKMAGFPDVCQSGDTCIGNSATALRICLGSPASTTTLDEVLNAQTLVLWGANIAETYPPYIRWIDEARQKGVKVVYVDPRKTPTSHCCDTQYMARPGTDGALILGLIRHLIHGNHYDRAYVSRYVNGFKELKTAAEAYTPEAVSKTTWVPAERVIELANVFANSRKTIIWMGGSLSRFTNSIQTVRAIVALQALTANLSGQGKGIMNMQGGKPGGVEALENKFYPKDLAAGIGFRKILYRMLQKNVDVLLLNSSFRRYPDANRVKKGISNVGFVVYRGFFMDEEAQLSHLIIPGTMAFESAGAQYGAQRQLVWRNQAVPAPGETVGDWRFYADLGQRLNPGIFPDVKSPEDIFELVRMNSPTWTGLTIERLKKDPTGISWPCPALGHPGTLGTLYPGNRFLTPHHKVELLTPALGPLSWSEPEGSPYGDSNEAKAFPLVFTQGKVVHHWQHSYTQWSAYMAQFSDGNYVQVNPKTVEKLEVKENDWVYLETELGKIKARVHLSEMILPGVVWTPSYPSGGTALKENKGVSINTIIPGYWDKVSAQFNGFGCRLTKV
ncbi:MAG TPA: molybdopterin-dependent oxidoreductase, partial [Geobacteraceae bacterium]|nr:molybdopterin-dependent oxidoreductase [Geobacteraceae bacterium]